MKYWLRILPGKNFLDFDDFLVSLKKKDFKILFDRHDKNIAFYPGNSKQLLEPTHQGSGIQHHYTITQKQGRDGIFYVTDSKAFYAIIPLLTWINPEAVEDCENPSREPEEMRFVFPGEKPWPAPDTFLQ